MKKSEFHEFEELSSSPGSTYISFQKPIPESFPRAKFFSRFWASKAQSIASETYPLSDEEETDNALSLSEEEECENANIVLENDIERQAESVASTFGKKLPDFEGKGSVSDGRRVNDSPLILDEEYFMKSELFSTCNDCKAHFGPLLRRIHCRLCGQIFCRRCLILVDLDPATNIESNFDAKRSKRVVKICSFCYSEFKNKVKPIQAVRHLKLSKTASLTALLAKDVLNSPYPSQKSRLDRLGKVKDESKKYSHLHAADSPTFLAGRFVKSMDLQSCDSSLLSEAFSDYLDLIVEELLLCEGIVNNFENWKRYIVSSALLTVSGINATSRSDDYMDIGRYFKILNCPGGTFDECEHISGISLCQTLGMNGMPTHFSDPKIILLDFPLEFQPTGDRIISFDDLISQEGEFLSLLASRISKMKPNIVFTSKSVCIEILEYFKKENIAVFSNVSPNNLIRLTRISGGQILKSMNAILAFQSNESILGRLKRFWIKEFVGDSEESTKHYAMLEGNSGNYSCFILRGESMELLQKTKRCFKSSVYFTYSLSLEQSFLIASGWDGDFVINEKVDNINDREQIRNNLSCDPLLEAELFTFPKPMIIPFPLERKHWFLPNPVFISFLYLRSNNLEYLLLPGESNVAPSETEDSGSFNMNSNVYDFNTLDFGVDNSRICSYRPYISHPSKYYQSILVDYSMYCTSSSNHCIPHTIQWFHFYSPMDIRLGEYILRSVRKSSLCPADGCGKPIFMHEQLFFHGELVISLTISELTSDYVAAVKASERDLNDDCSLGNNENNSPIFFGNRCNFCENRSEFIAMSRDVYNFSFGRFLQFMFCGKDKISSGVCDKHSCDFIVPIFVFANMMVKFEKKKNERIFDISPANTIFKTSKTSLEEGAPNPSSRELFHQFLSSTIDETKTLIENVSQFLEKKNILILDFISRHKNTNDTAMALITNLHNSFIDEVKSKEQDFFADVEKIRETEDMMDQLKLKWKVRVFFVTCKSKLTQMALAVFDTFTEDITSISDPGPLSVSSFSPNITNLKKVFVENVNDIIVDKSSDPSFIESEIYCTLTSTISVPSGDIDSSDSYHPPLMHSKEPSSIIAFTLGSLQYQEKIEQDFAIDTTSPNTNNLLPSSSPNRYYFDSDHVFVHKKLNDKLKAPNLSSSFESLNSKDKDSRHVFCNFSENYEDSTGHVKVRCVVYFAKEFSEIRKSCLWSVDDGKEISDAVERSYIRSLSRCLAWKAKGGKSNAKFAKTFDGKFVLKQVQEIELQTFLRIAPLYFNYLSDSNNFKVPSVLARIFGIYSVSFRNMHGRKYETDVIVMENLFFQRNVSIIYDLKGSFRSRLAKNDIQTTSESENEKNVLLDRNLVNVMHSEPLCISDTSKQYLYASLSNDSRFLASIGMMDYSLLVGIDNHSKELVVGIIDYMRIYSWDKQMETWLKKNITASMNPPTIISPAEYRKRFCDSLWQYFHNIPNYYSVKPNSY